MTGYEAIIKELDQLRIQADDLGHNQSAKAYRKSMKIVRKYLLREKRVKDED